MATLQQKLADSLQQLKKLQNKKGLAIVKSSYLTRVHLERLVNNGFLTEVMKGWYISSSPDSSAGDSTNWYISFWYFVAEYANSRFGDKWSLSPEQSLSFYSGNTTVPRQVIIRIAKNQSNVVNLLHETSVLFFKANLPNSINKDSQFNLNLYSLPEALVESSPNFYKIDNISARSCLSLIQDESEILKILLEKGQTTKAGRLAGAFRNIGNEIAANEIVNVMKRLGYDIREEDPFENKSTIGYSRTSSPYTIRLKLMWNSMREVIIKNFPKSENTYTDIDKCINQISAQYRLDAYNSLSIEGYIVTDELIERVRSGNWNPDSVSSDTDQRNAMAARGYWQAFEAVKNSVRTILKGTNAGEVVNNELRTWYRELFTPSVTVGLLKPSDLAGYRTSQVYIKGSLHTPLNPDALRDAMPVFFELLINEPDARVRAILGHFIFVYIHPYTDGNGRIARFIMNSQLISGGYNWIIIPVERRVEYMATLEKASVNEDILEFTLFIASLY